MATITTRDIVGTGYVDKDRIILRLADQKEELRNALRQQVRLNTLKDELIAALEWRIEIMEQQRAA
jgi:hypothetical protein